MGWSAVCDCGISLSYLLFQRLQKALLWSKGFSVYGIYLQTLNAVMSTCHSNAYIMQTSSVFEVCNQVRFKTSRSATKTDHKNEKLDVACILLLRQ